MGGGGENAMCKAQEETGMWKPRRVRKRGGWKSAGLIPAAEALSSAEQNGAWKGGRLEPEEGEGS